MALRSRQMRDVAVADADAARGGRVQSRDHAQRGRLAAARWPQQHGEAARRRGEADALDRGGLAILFGQVFQDERGHRSAEHTSELQSLLRSSYAVFCFKKKKDKTQ